MSINREYRGTTQSVDANNPPLQFLRMDPTMNPYALSGWYNPANPANHCQVPHQPWRPMPPGPATTGVLPPAQSTPIPPSTQLFEFKGSNKDLLNCSVVGDGGRVFFRVETLIPERTIIFKGNEPYAFIQWSGSSSGPSPSRGGSSTSNGSAVVRPWIQTTNHSIPKQPIGDFLRLSEDGR